MKSSVSSHPPLFIAVVSPEEGDVTLIRTTLAHVYPGASILLQADDKPVHEGKPHLVIINTERVALARLEHLLDLLVDTPAILIVRDLAEIRRFSGMLHPRRSILTRDDLRGNGLLQGVHHLLERQQLAEQLARTSRRLKELSIRDELTKLYNHRHLDELLGAEIKKANRYRRPMGLIIVGIKNFTAINETCGHHEGDRILARAAEIIRQAIREVDIPARYGDNEFGIILPESDEAATSLVARRIQEALATLFASSPGKTTPLVTSCGIAALSSRIQTKEELLRTALAALLEAKRGGTNTLCTSEEVAARRRELHANRQLIEQLHERIVRLTMEAERSYVQSVMRLIGEVPLAKRLLMPHSERVAFFAQRLAEAAGLSEPEVRTVHRAGLLHDAGKLAIDAEILGKPDLLTPSERELVRQHPLFASQMFGATPFFAPEMAAVLHHHERADGTGYPEGIGGDAIPPSARILAIAEAWDTMITPQPYRSEPLALDAALAEIRRGAGNQFDADLSERFVALIGG